MNVLNTMYLKLLQRLSKRFAVLCILVIVGTAIASYPNPVTHKCVPNIRTIAGISSEGYPLAHHFCKPGYYPVLRFGQDDANNTRMLDLFIIAAFLLILPVAYLLYIRFVKQYNAHK